ncbi:hypothetical protein [Parahaliea mediterranea]|uniref:hypothetical protein n=1 Tax=Parahaliea mediterranea TaxID=651086 RepID=UPI000E2F6832|nr:hypothetical protein [Parahaliea mediterranea]
MSDFLARYKFFHRLLILWAMWIITWTVMETYLLAWHDKVTTPVGVFGGAVIGILAVAVGFLERAK